MKQKTAPDLQDILENSIEDLLYSFNCHRVGVIESFNPSNQTATITLVDKGTQHFSDGERLAEYPPLVDCPVVVNKTTNGGLTIPINEGDSCLVLFNDRDIDSWFENGLKQKPNSMRTHDIADAVALVGIRNEINKFTDYNNAATTLNYLANKIEIGNSRTQLLRSEGAEINLDDKLELKNTAQSLKLILDELLVALSNLKTVSPMYGSLPIDSATLASLGTLSTKVDALLK